MANLSAIRKWRRTQQFANRFSAIDCHDRSKLIREYVAASNSLDEQCRGFEAELQDKYEKHRANLSKEKLDAWLAAENTQLWRWKKNAKADQDAWVKARDVELIMAHRPAYDAIIESAVNEGNDEDIATFVKIEGAFSADIGAYKYGLLVNHYRQSVVEEFREMFGQTDGVDINQDDKEETRFVVTSGGSFTKYLAVQVASFRDAVGNGIDLEVRFADGVAFRAAMGAPWIPSGCTPSALDAIDVAVDMNLCNDYPWNPCRFRPYDNASADQMYVRTHTDRERCAKLIRAYVRISASRTASLKRMPLFAAPPVGWNPMKRRPLAAPSPPTAAPSSSGSVVSPGGSSNRPAAQETETVVAAAAAAAIDTAVVEHDDHEDHEAEEPVVEEPLVEEPVVEEDEAMVLEEIVEDAKAVRNRRRLNRMKRELKNLGVTLQRGRNLTHCYTDCPMNMSRSLMKMAVRSLNM